MIWAAGDSEMLVHLKQTTWHYKPEVGKLICRFLSVL